MNGRVEGCLRTRALARNLLIVAVVMFGLAASSASAREYTAAHKFRRGFSNMTLGVLAIPGQMTVKTREDGYAIGLPLGFAQGLGWFVATEVIGIWEFLTCPFEFPPRFRPIIEPEYPWNYFEKGNSGAGIP
jgi:putative exosortase-associated protein (TIGR04073 family)